jgi:hypothetical protein
MHNASPERLHGFQRARLVVDCEIGQRERVPRSAATCVHPDSHWPMRGGWCLPALAFGVAAGLELETEELAPEAPGTLRVISRELDEGQRKGAHHPHVSGRPVARAV